MNQEIHTHRLFIMEIEFCQIRFHPETSTRHDADLFSLSRKFESSKLLIT